MPDQSDVEAALAAFASGALYPDGSGGEPTVGMMCRVFRGYPDAAPLGADLSAGRANVSVTPVDGSYHNTTRYMTPIVLSAAVPTLTAAAAGNTLVLSGSGGAGQLAGVLVDATPYVYRTSAGDTPAVVAAALAALVRADRPAVLSGSAVSFPGAFRVVGRTVADTPDSVELRRQSQHFRITVWAPSPAARDAVCGLLDEAFAGVAFLDVSGSGCRVQSCGTSTSDTSTVAGLFQRDLLLSVEYPTTVTVDRPAMLFGVVTDNGAQTFA